MEGGGGFGCDYDRVNVKLLPDIIIKGGEYVESCEDVTTLE